MPLLDANHQIQTGTKNIPVCLLPPPPGYGRVGPDVNLPGVKWLDNRRALFKVHFQADSNVHISDRSVHDFIKSCLAAEQVTPTDTFASVSGRRMPVEQLQAQSYKSHSRETPTPLCLFFAIFIIGPFEAGQLYAYKTSP